MRFATWSFGGETAAGAVNDDAVHGFVDGHSVLDIVELGLDEAIALGQRAIEQTPPTPLSQVRLLPPIAPRAVRDFAVFEKHVQGALLSVTTQGRVPDEWYRRPTFYFANPHALIGAFDDVAMPPGCTEFDFELEVAVITTGEARSVTPDRAREHIFGYTIMNDWSARDIQVSEMKVGLGPAKSKDSATTLGPWIVTRDELAGHVDEHGVLDLDLRVLVNGIEVGRDRLSNMGWTFAELIAQAAHGTVVRPGDVLGSGTCGNGGSLAELWGFAGERTPPPLQVGDVVDMVVEGIGTIRNRVVAGISPVDIPAVLGRR